MVRHGGTCAPLFQQPSKLWSTLCLELEINGANLAKILCPLLWEGGGVEGFDKRKRPLPSLPNSLGSPPPPKIPSAKYVNVPLTKEKCFCHICNAGWQKDSLIPPPHYHPNMDVVTNVPYVPPLLPHPRLPCDTSACPILECDSD